MCNLENRPGSLFELLQRFSERKVNLTKIESRPIPDTDFEFMFYIDFTGDAKALAQSGFLDELESSLGFFRLLGAYNEETVPAPEVTANVLE